MSGFSTYPVQHLRPWLGEGLRPDDLDARVARRHGGRQRCVDRHGGAHPARRRRSATASIVAARSVVSHDVPPYAIVAGNPAKVVKMRFDDTTSAAAGDRLVGLAGRQDHAATSTPFAAATSPAGGRGVNKTNKRRRVGAEILRAAVDLHPRRAGDEVPAAGRAAGDRLCRPLECRQVVADQRAGRAQGAWRARPTRRAARKSSTSSCRTAIRARPATCRRWRWSTCPATAMRRRRRNRSTTGRSSSSTISRAASTLKRVYVLIDARHGIKKNDEEVLGCSTRRRSPTRSCSPRPTRSSRRRDAPAGGDGREDPQAPGGFSGGHRHLVRKERGPRRVARGDRHRDHGVGRSGQRPVRHQHRDGGALQNGLRHAAEQQLPGAAVSMRAHDDQVGLVAAGGTLDRRRQPMPRLTRPARPRRVRRGAPDAGRCRRPAPGRGDRGSWPRRRR